MLREEPTRKLRKEGRVDGTNEYCGSRPGSITLPTTEFGELRIMV